MFHKKLPLALWCATVTALPALSAPPSFMDDLVTPATYDTNSLIQACTTGVGPKWTVYGTFDALYAYQHLVIGGGSMRYNATMYWNPVLPSQGDTLFGRIDTIAPGWTGLGLDGAPGFPATCLNEPSPGVSNMPFTDDDICIYGGHRFNAFELTPWILEEDDYGAQFGFDHGPGVRGVDDDGNGLTDDDPNCTLGNDGLPGRPNVDDDGNGTTDLGPSGNDLRELYFCTCGWDDNCGDNSQNDDVLGPNGVNQAEMRRAGEYLSLGPDGCAGSCGVDDDGNGITDWLDPYVPGYETYDDDQDGTTDEVGERQPDLSDFGFGDDSDDLAGEMLTYTMMRANLGSATGISLYVDTQFQDGQFQLGYVFFGDFTNIGAPNDEIGPQFYQAGVDYSYAFCASGSCYGAQMWIGDDVANPVETIGPGIDTNALNKTTDKDVGVIMIQANNSIFTPFSNKTTLGNKYLGGRFWILQGPPGEEDVIVASDRDGDFDVDGVDFSIFASCFNKAGNPPRTLGCTTADAEAFDADGDGDVDGVDFSRFASCFNKAGNPPRATGCIPIVASGCVNCTGFPCDSGFHCELDEGVPVCVAD
jgi:hypothetical protein